MIDVAVGGVADMRDAYGNFAYNPESVENKEFYTQYVDEYLPRNNRIRSNPAVYHCFGVCFMADVLAGAGTSRSGFNISRSCCCARAASILVKPHTTAHSHRNLITRAASER